MERDFWKESAASLRESKIKKAEKANNEQSKEKRDFYTKNESLNPIRQLENAYGKFIFGEKKDKYVITVNRKSEFKEETFDNSRESLNANRVNEQKISGGRIISDSHNKKESAVIYEESVKNAPAERIFKDLKYTAEKGNKTTLNEMMPEKYDIEKKIFQSIKCSVEELKKEKNDKSYDLPFFKKIFNYVSSEENGVDDNNDQEEN